MGRALTIALWCLWLLVLLATPFSLAGFGETPPYLVSSYACVALGLVAGVACASIFKQRLSLDLPCAGVVAIAILGAVLTVFLVVPEWAYFCSGSLLGEGLWPEDLVDLPVLGPALAAAGTLVEDGDHDILYQALLVSCGAACSSVACWFDTSLVRRGCGMGGRSGESRTGARAICVLVFLVVFLLGACMPGFWAPYATAVGSLHLETWKVEAVPFFRYLPTLCLYFGLVLELVLGAVVFRRSGCLGAGSPGCLGSFVAALAAGQLTWNLVSRCVKVSRLFDITCAPLGIAVIVMETGLAALLIAAWVLSRSARRLAAAESDAETGAPDPASILAPAPAPAWEGLEDVFSGWGLAPSEQNACRLMLEGKTSKESAEILGLKSSTVRNYLQRSYRKAGVSSAEEFRRLLEER